MTPLSQANRATSPGSGTTQTHRALADALAARVTAGGWLALVAGVAQALGMR